VTDFGPFDLVIFDNDGVLVDSERVANTILADLLTGDGLPTTVAGAMRDYMGGSVARAREIAEERLGRPLFAGFEEQYHQRLYAAFEHLEPVPGVVAVLDALAAAGLPYCVASSGAHDRIRRALRTVGLLDRFDDQRIFSVEDVTRGKPAPDLFLHAAEALGHKPDRCAVIEDSPFGIQAAKAAGMAAFGYAAMTPRERLAEADLLVTDMTDLIPVLTSG
jgi:HAD superfamily hydrolase (TIGR01509 family)